MGSRICPFIVDQNEQMITIVVQVVFYEISVHWFFIVKVHTYIFWDGHKNMAKSSIFLCYQVIWIQTLETLSIFSDLLRIYQLKTVKTDCLRILKWLNRNTLVYKIHTVCMYVANENNLVYFDFIEELHNLFKSNLYVLLCISKVRTSVKS